MPTRLLVVPDPSPSGAAAAPTAPAAAHRRRTGRRRLAPVAAVLAVLSVSACGSDAPTTDPAGSAPGDAAAGARSTDASGTVTATCEWTPSGREAARPVDPPATSQPASGTVTTTLDFAGGPVEVTLDRAAAPCTVGNFVSLAEQGWFDAASCHRLTAHPGLTVLQCGDPTRTGRGGPPWVFDDEVPADAGTEAVPYPRGTVAMANAGPDTNGSQFFLVIGDSRLPPAYTVFGSVTGGLEVLDGIAAAGINGGGRDGLPAGDATIDAVSVAGAPSP
ncbi:peptidylprolyl isomerase [Nakamurella leprariae]|uniref:Peptidyl-prolyl cis-trans isomerase n=1 Tax=Nakamurella leprariae TaxID=2803911 RepID=A0A939C1N9_9ACTN|nr:peptidylprolyl isomerase [Nakamurella leprariae]MBM9467337.1 peptidylprolyl isomerase [Nakamurella leprariae]